MVNGLIQNNVYVVCVRIGLSEFFKEPVVLSARVFPSSKTCSSCTKINQNLTLADRLFFCEYCFSANRDLNAALNLNQYGLGHVTAKTLNAH